MGVHFPPMEGATKPPKEELPGATCFSRAFFGFIGPVIRLAKAEGKLDARDVPQHTMELETRNLCEFFEKQWHLERERTNQRPYMPRALAAGRWNLLAGTGAGYIAAQVLSLVGPVLLKQIIYGLSCRQQQREQPDVDVSGCEGGELRLYLCASHACAAIDQLY